MADTKGAPILLRYKQHDIKIQFDNKWVLWVDGKKIDRTYLSLTAAESAGIAEIDKLVRSKK
jgi:hypothetical protein